MASEGRTRRQPPAGSTTRVAAIFGALKKKVGLTVEATRTREVSSEVVVVDRAVLAAVFVVPRVDVIDVVCGLQKVMPASWPSSVLDVSTASPHSSRWLRRNRGRPAL
jgi:hypothetical protein